MLTFEEALDFMHRKGIILDKQYWNMVNYVVKDFDWLIIKTANALDKFDATDIEEN